jgi:outer membrane protein assembly factor BamB
MHVISTSSLFAVIPTFVLAGPLALLALVFPAFFAGLALLLRRWVVLLTVLSVNSSLLIAHAWYGGHAEGAWWGTPQALWAVMATAALAGAIVSFVNARRRTAAAPAAPSALPVEAIVLAGLAAGFVVAATISGPRSAPELVWMFEAAERGMILSSPRVAGNHVYVTAAHSTTERQFGAVYCLDRATGKALWTFNGDGRMKQAFSSPALHAGRLYVGEGLHEDTACSLYCLDAATGAKLWNFPTKSHIESSPCVAHGCVFFGAGDDGVYCLEGTDGALRWHFAGLHVDSTPAVAANRLYAGSGYGSREVFCLDTTTGEAMWRVPCDLSAFGSPTVAENQVFIGIGNGKLSQSAAQPAGALLCLDVATGRKLWRHDAGDMVFGAPAVAGNRVYFGSRDRQCYCLDRRDGGLIWQKDLGSPVVAAPLLFAAQLHVVTSSGMAYCLDSSSGAIVRHFDLAKHSQTAPEILGTPALAFAADRAGTRPRLYVGAGLHYSISSAAVVFCLKAPGDEDGAGRRR